MNQTLPGLPPKPGGSDSLFPRACTSNKSWIPQNIAKEFRFDCNASNVAAPGRDVYGVWHVGLVKNWQEVVADQLTSLTTCGLLDRTRRLYVVLSGPGLHNKTLSVSSMENVLDRQLAHTDIHAHIDVLFSPRRRTPWEASSVLSTVQLCNGSADSLVYYIHSKGVSKYNAMWLARRNPFRSYANSLYWRKYMEYFVVENYQWCAKALADGFDTCGVDWGGAFYSGNMWWARCEYVATLPTQMPRAYLSAEVWIGRSRCPGQHANLHHGHMDLYEHLMYRDMYARTLRSD